MHFCSGIFGLVITGKGLKVLKMAAQDVFGTLCHTGQGICVLNWNLEKIYENEKAKKVFADQCPGLYQQFKDICQTAGRMADTANNSVMNHNGILRYPHGAVMFSCLFFGQGDQTCIYIIFDYAPLLDGQIADDIGLTPREKEIVRVMAAGKTNKEISETLCIGLETVKTHVRNIFAKTGVNSRLELVSKALQIRCR